MTEPHPSRDGTLIGQLAARGTPGSPIAADGRRHGRNLPCPADGPRYLTGDGHMWLPLTLPLDLRRVDVILSTAFPPRRR